MSTVQCIMSSRISLCLEWGNELFRALLWVLHQPRMPLFYQRVNIFSFFLVLFCHSRSNAHCCSLWGNARSSCSPPSPTTSTAVFVTGIFQSSVVHWSTYSELTLTKSYHFKICTEQLENVFFPIQQKFGVFFSWVLLYRKYICLLAYPNEQFIYT